MYISLPQRYPLGHHFPLHLFRRKAVKRRDAPEVRVVPGRSSSPLRIHPAFLEDVVSLGDFQSSLYVECALFFKEHLGYFKEIM